MVVEDERKFVACTCLLDLDLRGFGERSVNACAPAVVEGKK
jgi:hypothetical protein